MGKSEIILWIVSLAIFIILGLVGSQVAQNGSTMAKNGVISGEVNNIKNAAATWVGLNPILAMDGYCGITNQDINKSIPNLKLDATQRLASNGYNGVIYTIGCHPTTKKVMITIDGIPAENKNNIYSNLGKNVDPEALIEFASYNNDTSNGSLKLVYNQ